MGLLARFAETDPLSSTDLEKVIEAWKAMVGRGE
jgi:hypothetical protein